MWSPTQVIAALIGVAALVLGGFAIARTGLNTDHLFTPHVTVATLHHTPLLALSELAFGVLMLWAATKAFLGRGLVALLGIAVLGLGIVIITDVWPNRLHQWLGVHHRNGWLFVIVGVVCLLAVLYVPTLRRTRRTVVVSEPAPAAEAGVPAAEQPEPAPEKPEPAPRRHWWQRRRRRRTPAADQPHAPT